MTGLWPEGCGIALSGDEYKVSVTGLAFCVIWHNKHSGDWLTTFATPYTGCAGLPPKSETTHYDLCVAGAPSNHIRCASTGKRVTRFSGRFAPLRIVFPCHPYAGGRIKHLEASLHKHLYSKHGLLCHRLRGKGGGASHQRGISLALKGGWLFPLGRKPGCEGFIIRGRLL